jgi:hypothetical protein
MTDECPRCGDPADGHGASCIPGHVLRKSLQDRAAVAHRSEPAEPPRIAPRKEPVFRDAAMESWDLEEEPPELRSYAVRHRRRGWQRSHTKYFQRVHYAKRRFQRLLKSSGRAGLAPVEELVLLSREVGPWELERDVPWMRQ